MSGLFALLFLLSLILLPIGLIKPTILSRFHIQNPSRRKALLVFGGSLLLFFILTGITAPPPLKSTTLTFNVSPSPINTLIPSLSPSPSIEPSVTAISLNLEFVTVKRVVDGDTISLENGKVVRYIGIDTPETVDPRKPVQCFAKEASARNKELVEGQIVGLEKDVSETDKYGRLLRYVYKGDVLVNEMLVREGYAHSSTYPPDVKYQEKFLQAEQEARTNNLGLWGEVCATTPTSSQSITYPTNTQINKPVPTNSGNQIKQIPASGSYVCDCSKTCTKMSCPEAQYQLNVCGCSARDADKDGTACDSQCQ